MIRLSSLVARSSKYVGGLLTGTLDLSEPCQSWVGILGRQLIGSYGASAPLTAAGWRKNPIFSAPCAPVHLCTTATGYKDDLARPLRAALPVANFPFRRALTISLRRLHVMVHRPRIKHLNCPNLTKRSALYF